MLFSLQSWSKPFFLNLDQLSYPGEALRAHRARLQRMLKVKQLIELQLKLKDLMLAKQNSQEVPNPENDHSAPKEKCH